jgi:hypothetical protein
MKGCPSLRFAHRNQHYGDRRSESRECRHLILIPKWPISGMMLAIPAFSERFHEAWSLDQNHY